MEVLIVFGAFIAFALAVLAFGLYLVLQVIRFVCWIALLIFGKKHEPAKVQE